MKKNVGKWREAETVVLAQDEPFCAHSIHRQLKDTSIDVVYSVLNYLSEYKKKIRKTTRDRCNEKNRIHQHYAVKGKATAEPVVVNKSVLKGIAKVMIDHPDSTYCVHQLARGLATSVKQVELVKEKLLNDNCIKAVTIGTCDDEGAVHHYYGVKNIDNLKNVEKYDGAKTTKRRKQKVRAIWGLKEELIELVKPLDEFCIHTLKPILNRKWTDKSVSATLTTLVHQKLLKVTGRKPCPRNSSEHLFFKYIKNEVNEEPKAPIPQKTEEELKAVGVDALLLTCPYCQKRSKFKGVKLEAIE